MTNLSFKMKVILIFFISTVSYRQMKIKANLLIFNSLLGKGDLRVSLIYFFLKCSKEKTVKSMDSRAGHNPSSVLAYDFYSLSASISFKVLVRIKQIKIHEVLRSVPGT